VTATNGDDKKKILREKITAGPQKRQQTMVDRAENGRRTHSNDSTRAVV
jgi:hypothetical protein